MTYLALIEARAAAALAEIKLMGDRARAEIAFRFAWINRSTGQKRRYARLRKEMK